VLNPVNLNVIYSNNLMKNKLTPLILILTFTIPTYSQFFEDKNVHMGIFVNYQSQEKFESSRIGASINFLNNKYLLSESPYFSIAVMKNDNRTNVSMNALVVVLGTLVTMGSDGGNETYSYIGFGLFAPLVILNSKIHFKIIDDYFSVFGGNTCDLFLLSERPKIYYDFKTGVSFRFPINEKSKLNISSFLIKPIANAYLKDEGWRYGVEVSFNMFPNK
jgi:hypothetical protein